MADTARVTALASALSKHGLAVTLFVHRIVGEMHTVYPFDVFALSIESSIIKKRSLLGLMTSRVKLLWAYTKMMTSQRFRAVYFYGPNVDNLILAFLTRYLWSTRVIVEYTDAINRSPSSVGEYLQNVSFRIFPKVSFQVAVISIRLERYFKIFHKLTPIRLNAFSGRNQTVPHESSVKTSPSALDEVVTITYAGSLLPSEGVGDVLDAVINVNKDTSFVHLNVAGFSLTAESESLQGKLRAFENRTDITFHGFLHERELEKVLRSSDILIIAKRNLRVNRYGFSTKLPEYLNYGKVVICSDIGEFRSFLDNCCDVVFFNPDVQGDLIRAINVAVRQTKMVRCSEHAVHLAEFDSERNVVKLLSAL
jgi:glycosyltransferase involved in cell wall biosynthesis